jgi:hypothetical protein
MAWRVLDFKVGRWPTQVNDLQGLSNNVSLLRGRYQSSPIGEDEVVRGLVRIETSSASLWSVEISKGNGWIQLFRINTTSGMVEYPGGFVSGDSLQDGAIDSTHVVDGTLPSRVIAPNMLKEHHVASGALVRAHIGSGAVREGDISDRAITKGRFAPESVGGNKIAIREMRRERSTAKDMEFRYFYIGFPDVVGSGAIIYSRSSGCGFEGSSDGRTGFRLRSTNTTSMQVSGYMMRSS